MTSDLGKIRQISRMKKGVFLVLRAYYGSVIWNVNLSELIFYKFTNKTFLFGNINSKWRLQLKVETLNLTISRNYLSFNCYLLLSKHFKSLSNATFHLFCYLCAPNHCMDDIEIFSPLSNTSHTDESRNDKCVVLWCPNPLIWFTMCQNSSRHETTYKIKV